MERTYTQIYSYEITTPMFKLDHDHGSSIQVDFRIKEYQKDGLFEYRKTAPANRIGSLHHFPPKCQFRAKMRRCWSGTRTLSGPLKNPPSGPVDRS